MKHTKQEKNRSTKTKRHGTGFYIIKGALQWLKKGDPTEAVRVLNTVLNAAKKYNIHLIHLKQIEKARDEADIGNPATAETFLEMILSDL